MLTVQMHIRAQILLQVFIEEGYSLQSQLTG